MYIPRIIVTSGEPAGIGPDARACTLVHSRVLAEADLVVAGDAGRCWPHTAPMHLQLPLRLVEL